MAPSESEDPSADRRRTRVALTREGLRLAEQTVPLHAGSVHYWRLEPSSWRACLEATKALGARLIDVYVPWNVHETGPGVLELGQTDPQRDVVGFLRLCHELELLVILRPGPHINAELTYFGIPERVVWDTACQAKTPAGNPVMLPMVPFAFPVPSYASDAFLDEVTRYFQALAPALASLRYPEGPIVLLQVDNEGALYFRDGAYDQDYHPDAIRLYREFLRDKYGTIERLEAVMGPSGDGEPLRFATVEPPRRMNATTHAELARHLDWSQFHEQLLGTAFERFGKALALAGLGGIPTTHNLPMGQETTPLNAARVARAVDLVGLDYYYPAGPTARRVIARRTSELAVHCEGHDRPAFACEMGAGFPPFFPPLDERDSAFTALAALAYGLRGLNIYMAVERDRWVGAPIDAKGRARPFAAFWTKLFATLERTRFASLRRRAPVRILVPRSERRLTRVMHAWGPVSGALFSVFGAGAREAAFEDDLGLGYPVAMESAGYVDALEQALEARGVPHAMIGGEDREVALEGAAWIVCATGGALNPALMQRLEEAAARGAVVTFGPRAPTMDGSFATLAEPLVLERARPQSSSVPLLLGDDPAALDAAVASAIVELGLPTFASDPHGIHVTVHEDASGAPRVMFVINPGDHDVVARITVPKGATRVADAFDDTTLSAVRGAAELRVAPKSVRMLTLG